MSSAKITVDHDAIREWAEQRGGRPSKVNTEGAGGILRLDFGEKEENLEQIDWPEFSRIFDENGLAFLYQDEGESRFNKFVNRPSDLAD
jgi:hypothetical protein